jgi:hypothetical protein
MTKTIKQALVIDALTGEVLQRDFTDDELKQSKADAAQAAARQAEYDAKAAARASALAKLADLGLTAEEIAAL